MAGHPRKRPIWRGASVVLALLSAAASLAGCGGKQPEAAQVLRVGNQRGGTHALMLAAGQLKDMPYKIEWAEFPNAQPLIEAIATNALDLGLVGGPSFLFAYKNDQRLRAIQALSGGTKQEVAGVLVHKNASFANMQDLRGKAIGTTRGSVGHSLLLQALRQSGMKPSDVRISFVAPTEAVAAFASGDLDALAIWVPYLATAVLRHDARVLTYAHRGTSSYLFQVTSESSIKDKRALLEDFSRRYGRAQSWANSHPRQWGEILAKETGLPLDVANYTAEHMRWWPVPIDAQVIESQRVAARDFGTGGPAQNFDIARGFDASLNTDPTAKGKPD
ncbi:ABC transporter substrate-binding protein [Sphingobium indicum]|uniref:Putative aliphatic sulfonates-binding protein n=1 Tax=Sphingobium indicum F2 TaxID=1450518 RepID=A0A8E0WTM5_9SPHN|nr:MULTISPECIES: ABC transporter substrate-binding protein [Sphingobium]KER36975.1 ABC transporter substrate-binding protein [Sphingobium indicum F2]